ncbi:MAG: hypothetical protein KDC49_14175 [Saprospiraceae bacterium]|nr:hypothetical protein [Saprospiraceae bacterium]
MKRIFYIIFLVFSTNFAFSQPTLQFCPGTVDGFTDENGFRNFNCFDVANVLFMQPVTYQLDNNGNLIANSISTPQAELVMTTQTGFAEFVYEPSEGDDEDEDQCFGNITVTITDQIQYGATPTDDAIITRTFTAVCNGNVVSPDICFQDIIFENCNRFIAIPTLSSWAVVITLLLSTIFATVWYLKPRKSLL